VNGESSGPLRPAAAVMLHDFHVMPALREAASERVDLEKRPGMKVARRVMIEHPKIDGRGSANSANSRGVRGLSGLGAGVSCCAGGTG